MMQQLLMVVQTINSQSRVDLEPRQRKEEKETDGEKSHTESFKNLPWFPISLLALCILVYWSFIYNPKVIEYAPIINGACFIVAMFAAMQQLST
mmetsp:Transcript_12012/g.14943  ORF Transcript_12012/g.14943 Transcript_12012/m.14943 type:complete len:94 (-) Transcript_12012:523-804(-)